MCACLSIVLFLFHHHISSVIITTRLIYHHNNKTMAYFVNSIRNSRQIFTILPQKWNLSVLRTMCSNVESSEKSFIPSEHYDIIIAGGGMVGICLACSISKNSKLQHKKILLLEGAPKYKGFTGEGYSNRVSALSKGTKELMKSIGAWDVITSARHKPVKKMQVWDASSDALITFNHDNFSDDVCYIVENDLILHAVLSPLNDYKNVTIENNSKIKTCNLPNSHNFEENSIVELNNGKSYSCELLIGADGANSIVRQQMGVNNLAVSYNQMGVVATVELTDAEDNSVAWQRFLPTGPVALLPLTNTLSSLVWSTTPQHAKELIQMSGENFVDALNSAFCKDYPKSELTQTAMKVFDTILGNSQNHCQYPPLVREVKDKSRAGFPLGFGHSSSYVTHGVALIGDAAHRVHPLAGQGVNLGFGDVKCLTEVLGDGVYSGLKLGDLTNLLKYEQSRLQSNVPIMLGIHGLQQIYGTTFSPLVMMRSLGLRLTDSVPSLKKLFMKKAMA